MSEITTNADPLQSDVPLGGEHPEGRDAKRMTGFGADTLLRGVACCVGLAFFITSVGLWAFTAPDASVMLIKLGASIVFLGAAAVFLLIGIAPHDFYRLEYDRRAGELRMLERDANGQFYLQAKQRLAEVDKLRFEGGALRAWKADGQIVLSVPMRARHAKAVLGAVLTAG